MHTSSSAEYEQQLWMLQEARKISKRIAKQLNDLSCLGAGKQYIEMVYESRALAKSFLTLWPSGEAPPPVVYLAKSVGLLVSESHHKSDLMKWDRLFVERKIVQQNKSNHLDNTITEEEHELDFLEPDDGIAVVYQAS